MNSDQGLHFISEGGYHGAEGLVVLRSSASGAVLDWHYGPTEDAPEPDRMWHNICGGEVYSIDEGLICSRCDQETDEPGGNP